MTMTTKTTRRVAGRAVAAVLSLSVAACASGAVAGSRPSPFPGAPSPTWTWEVGADHASMMSAVLRTAISLRGLPYQFGGDTPDAGFDCSGFVRYVFAQYQMNVPRTVAEQFRTGFSVDREHPTTGDLIFFSTTGPGATHVGIVLDPEEQTFVHAPGTGSVVRIDRFDAPYWRSRTLGVRRLPTDGAPAS